MGVMMQRFLCRAVSEAPQMDVWPQWDAPCCRSKRRPLLQLSRGGPFSQMAMRRHARTAWAPQRTEGQLFVLTRLSMCTFLGKQRQHNLWVSWCKWWGVVFTANTWLGHTVLLHFSALADLISVTQKLESPDLANQGRLIVLASKTSRSVTQALVDHL